MRPEIDRYSHLNSPIHCWDPRVKIATLTLLIFSIASVQRLQNAAVCLVISLSLVFLTRIPYSFSLKRLAAVTMFLGPFFIVMPLTMRTRPGDTIYFFSHLEFMEINARGLSLAGMVYLKAISIVLLVVPMFGTNRFDISIKALERLKVPNKIVQMILFSYRYIFVFLAEMRRMAVGMQVRGFEKKSDTHTLKTMGNFVGVLLVRSFERTERVYHAMLSRGYKGVLNTYFDYKITVKDLVKGLLVIAVSGLILFQNRIFLFYSNIDWGTLTKFIEQWF